MVSPCLEGGALPKEKGVLAAALQAEEEPGEEQEAAGEGAQVQICGNHSDRTKGLCSCCTNT